MKLRKVSVENFRSFLERAELSIDGDISILIGPNGGGKTNLLDATTIALRRYVLQPWVHFHEPQPGWQDRWVVQINQQIHTIPMDKHSKGDNRGQILEIELELSEEDLQNIVSIKNGATELAAKIKSKYAGADISSASSWPLEGLHSGQVFSFRILDGNVQALAGPGRTVQAYLAMFEAHDRLRNELGLSALSVPMLSFPTTRAGQGFNAEVSLANYNERDVKQNIDIATSRSGGVDIGTLAVGRIALRYRELEREVGEREAMKRLRVTPHLVQLTNTLQKLGYSWKLQTVNIKTNHYGIALDKQGSSFLIGSASSGERQILSYLFAIYGLHLRNSLILIDEPELHLHPKWQTVLLGLIEEVSERTKNQFLLATHSTSFISPSSIQYVSRVFSESQQSRIIRLEQQGLPKQKHLFSIVNAQNNERIFFCDTVVLVEGLSDRIFLEAVFKKFKTQSLIKTVEIIEVHGKNFFPAYEQVLKSCKVEYFIIADRDYLKEVGTSNLKSLFRLNEKKWNPTFETVQVEMGLRSFCEWMRP